MEVMSSVSFHRIFSLHETNTDHIECIDEIDADDTHSSRDLATDDDSTGCYDKGKNHGSCISNKSGSFGVQTCHEESSWDHDRHECEEEFGVFLYVVVLIDEVELESQSCHDDKTHE